MEDTVSELLELARLDEADGPLPLDVAPRSRPRRARARRHRAATPGAGRHRARVGRPRARPPRAARARRAQPARQRGASRVDDGRGRAASPTTTEVELTVDDDGPGIPVEDRERVFERFTRLDDGRARDAGGLGLGLSMVKAIVEQHGGSVVDRRRPDGRRPGPRAAPGRLTPYRAIADARADHLQLQLPRRPAGRAATACASPTTSTRCCSASTPT